MTIYDLTNDCYMIFYMSFTFVDFYIEQIRRALHVIQALNGNKCNAYFVSGRIK